MVALLPKKNVDNFRSKVFQNGKVEIPVISCTNSPESVLKHPDQNYVVTEKRNMDD